MDNFLVLKTINEVCGYTFFVPSYQRGYRWKEREIHDLLNDIYDFVPKEVKNSDGEKTWYCLQPIVVKEGEDGKYEVIDGQQRLTTVYLILHYLNQRYVEEEWEKIFELQYETRSKNNDFLKKPQEYNDSNIDFYYISEAYKSIKSWFDNKKNSGNFDMNGFQSKLRFQTRFIWYSTSEVDTVSVFTRLNIGKIALTNSELIKALFLNSSNFKEASSEQIYLRQLEIANEWDSFEHGLQNEKLWHFLNEEEKESNRIEFIFDLISKKPTAQDEDPDFAFRFYNNKMVHKSKDVIEGLWKEVKTYYQRFNEWYNQRPIYHKIGFILKANIVSITDLYDVSSQMKKSEFLIHLDKIIKRRFEDVSLLDLQIEDKKHVKHVLLLYNILTMLQNEQENSYFPFDSYDIQKWDIEHISATKSSAPENENFEIKIRWLEDVIPHIDKEDSEGGNLLNKIQTAIETIEKENSTELNDLFDPIIKHFNNRIHISEEDANRISNLALLDSATNRGYKNAVFPVKRKIIIDKDKNGVFIPLGTKNVFLKYFSNYPPKISFWTDEDRQKYEEDLCNILKKYMEV